MNARLKEMLARVETWPEDAQEHAAEVLEVIEHQWSEPLEPLSPEDIAAIKQAEADIREGRFVSLEEIKSLLDSYRIK